MKKIIVLMTLLLSGVFANAQDDDAQLFEKEYKFPLTTENGKSTVSGAMDFTKTDLDDDAIFTNLYSWISKNVGRDNVITISPTKKIISCKYSVEGKNAMPVTGKKNVYWFATAFRVADKRMYVKQTELEVTPAMSLGKKNVGIEKYAALKKPADKTVIDEFNDINNELLESLMDYISTNVPEQVTNWDYIVSRRVVENMTKTEVELAFGAPQSIVEGNEETQWMYGLSLIVYFDNKTNKVTRILR